MRYIQSKNSSGDTVFVAVRDDHSTDEEKILSLARSIGKERAQKMMSIKSKLSAYLVGEETSPE